MKILPKRGMPKPFSGIRASGRGKGHRRPWTLISSSSFLCIIFLVSNGQKTMAKPMKIIRLGADQMQEMLKYIHAEENANKNANEGQNGIEEKEEEMPILFELKTNNEWKSKIVAMEREEECRQMEDGEEQNSLKLRIRHFLHSQLQHIWSDQFEVKVLGMNVSIHSIRTRHIRPPHLQIDAICSTKDGSNRLIASLSGGSLTLLANYRSEYRTIREGTVHIRLGQFHGKLSTTQNECSQVGIDHLTVQFGPKLLEDVNDVVAMHLRERVKHLICNRLQQFLSQNYPLTTKR